MIHPTDSSTPKQALMISDEDLDAMAGGATPAGTPFPLRPSGEAELESMLPPELREYLEKHGLSLDNLYRMPRSN